MPAEHIGNEQGYLYSLDLNGDVIESFTNDSLGVEKLLSTSLFALPITSNIAPTGSITVLTATAGSITDVRVNGINQMNNPITIVVGDVEATAVLVATEINASTPASGARYKAQAVGGAVLLTAIELTNYETPNGHVTSVIATGTSTFDQQDVSGGLNASDRRSAIIDYDEILDPSRGVTVSLDANYAVGSVCSGEGTAVVGDASNAVDVTKFFLNKSILAGKDIVGNVVISENTATVERLSSDSVVYLTTSSGTTDLVRTFVSEGYVEGDEVTFLNNTPTDEITFEDLSVAGGNISLAGAAEYNSAGDEMITLMWDAAANFWREKSRSNTAIPEINTSNLADGAVTEIKIGDAAVSTRTLGTGVVTAEKIATQTITSGKLAQEAVTTEKIADGAVTADKVETSLKTQLIAVSLSFEANQQGDYKIRFPYDCTVNSFDAFVITPIEATNDATIVPKNHDDITMGEGVLTFPSGTPNGTGVTSTPISNNTFQAGEVLTMSAGKTTPGGSVEMSINVTILGAGETGGSILFQAPSFSSFLLSGFSILEVGDSIPSGLQTFTWTIANFGNVSPSSIEITDVTGATILGTAIADDGSEALVLPSAITKTVIGSNQFEIEATNTQAGLFARTYNVNWQFRAFYGNDSNAGMLTEAQVEALANNPLKSAFGGEYFFPGGDYKHFAFPDAWGTPGAFVDKATSLPIAMQSSYVVSITNGFGVVENYNVFRTANILNSDITIVVS